jgi:hypothetical protein
MGRTIPSFRLALAEELSEWKPFRNTLSRSKRKKFDEMLSLTLLYISACSCAVKPLRLQPVLMSILFHHYQLLLEASQKLGGVNLDELISE